MTEHEATTDVLGLCSMTGHSESTVRKYANSGAIPCTRGVPGSRNINGMRFRVADVDAIRDTLDELVNPKRRARGEHGERITRLEAQAQEQAEQLKRARSYAYDLGARLLRLEIDLGVNDSPAVTTAAPTLPAPGIMGRVRGPGYINLGTDHPHPRPPDRKRR